MTVVKISGELTGWWISLFRMSDCFDLIYGVGEGRVWVW